MSQATRVVLTNSTLNSIPLHSLNVTWLSVTALNGIIQYIRNFRWANAGQARGLHLIAWDMVTLSRREGGLGIKDLHLMRFALQGKRIMHYLNRLENLWFRL